MALTQQDLDNIGTMIKDIVNPQFQELRDDINNLAAAAAEQFLVIDDRFAQMDQRFEQINNLFGQVHGELAAIKDAVVDHGYRLAKLEA